MAKMINGEVLVENAKLPLGWHLPGITYGASGVLNGKNGYWVRLKGFSYNRFPWFFVEQDADVSQISKVVGEHLACTIEAELCILSVELGMNFSPEDYIKKNNLGISYLRNVAENGPTDTDIIEIGWMQEAATTLTDYCKKQVYDAAT